MMTYDEAAKLFIKAKNKDKGYRLPGRMGSTRLCQVWNGDYQIVLHGTAVVTIHSNGTYTLYTGGYYTKTTMRRMNQYSPAHVYQRNWQWYLHGQIKFYNDIKVNSQGDIVKAIDKNKGYPSQDLIYTTGAR